MPEKPLVEAFKAILADDRLDDQQKVDHVLDLLRADHATRLESSVEELARKKAQLAQVKVELACSESRIQMSREAMLEMYKLWFEAYKNQTILSSGAVLAFAAVTAALVPDPAFLWLLGLSYACILVSIVATIGAMRETSIVVGETLSPDHTRRPRHPENKIRYRLSWGTFVASLALFLGFVTANLLWA